MSRTRAGHRAGVQPTVEPLECRDLPSGFPVHAFKLPKGTNFPDHLTVGAGGNVWFSCGLASKVGFITRTGATKVFKTTSVSSHGLDGLTRGPDNNIWFVELFDNKIGKITPTGHITQHRLQHGPTNIATGPDRKLWITTFDNHLGRVTLSGRVTWFAHNGEGVNKIVPFHGALYLQEDDTIGRITINGAFTGEFKLPHGGHVQDMTVGPGGKLWFTEHGSGAFDFVGSMTAAGTIHEYPISTAHGHLGHLTAAGDGNLYVRQGDHLIGVHPNGKRFANQNLGFIAGDGSVVQGSNGNVWYAEGVLDKIGVAHVVR